MSWRYRVVRRVHTWEDEEEEEFNIHEYYPSEDGGIGSITVTPVAPYGSTLEDLERDLQWMRKALSEPVLEYDDFCDEEEKPA